jgi:hypothetical protein
MKLPWQKKPKELDEDAIPEFWAWFCVNADAVKDAMGGLEPGHQLGRLLSRIDQGLVFGVLKSEDTWVLEIGAGGDHHKIAAVFQTVAAAPPIAGWKVVPFRQPIPDFRLSLGNAEVSAETVKWLEMGERPGNLDIALYVPYPDAKAIREIQQMGLMALDSVLGEFNAMTKIGGVDFQHESVAVPEALPLSSLVSRIERLAPA